MPDSESSQSITWPDSTDSSSSELEPCHSWSNFTDSNKVMHCETLHAQAIAITAQLESGGSQSLCPSWSTSDWSPCSTWSSSYNHSNYQHKQWEAARLQSSDSSQACNKYDEDYNPGSMLSPPILTHIPHSEINASDNITHPTTAIHMLPYILFIH
jgi:hypothetical protein